MDTFISNSNTKEEKNNIVSVIKDRICHHRVRFLTMLINFYGGKLNNYLEIGVHNGASMSYVLQSNYLIGNCVGVDLFEDTFYNDNLNQNKIYSNLEQLNKNNNTIKLIKGNSNSMRVIDQVKEHTYDVIFIDGDHTYDGVKNDFVNYYPYLSKHGVMVFDDFNKANTNKGVYRFINEIIDNKKLFNNHYKFIDQEHNHSKYKDGIIAFFK